MSKHFETNSIRISTFQIKPKGAQFSFVSNLKFLLLIQQKRLVQLLAEEIERELSTRAHGKSQLKWSNREIVLQKAQQTGIR